MTSSIEIMIFARALQALGAAGGMVLARAMVGDLYSGDRAGRELSVISAVMGLGPVLAPLIGGVLQTGFGWRSVFFVLTRSLWCGCLLVLAGNDEETGCRTGFAKSNPTNISLAGSTCRLSE